jgi:ATP-dependent Clp protease ATP-binding subunit ClpA
LLSPELADRVDEIIAFRTLGDGELKEIVLSKISEFERFVSEKGIKVELAEDFCDRVLEMADTKSARTVSRTALRLAEDAFSELFLEKSPKKGETAKIFIKNGRCFAKITQNTY